MNEIERERFAAIRQRELDERTGRSAIARGRRSLFRPGELLVAHSVESAVEGALLRTHGARKFRPNEDEHWRNSSPIPAESSDLNSRLEPLGVSLWILPPEADAPDVVARLRSRLDDEPDGRVSLNHVYCGEPAYQGGPGGPPFRIDELAVGPATTGANLSRPDLAVLDTGLPVDWLDLHPRLGGSLVPDLDNDNKLHEPGSTTLASEAGHGLFICGLVHRIAPGLVIDPGRVLDTTGAGDDASLAVELAETQAPVVNLSLGGYTEDDAAPSALSDALAARGHDIVVIAAAGNNASTRPFWPAALKHVIAVAGYDSTGAQPKPAEFSNHGPWVDVAAPAVKLRSAYVVGDWPAPEGGRPTHFDGWAGWSGTSFAAPQVAAELARRLAAAAGARTARQVALDVLASLEPSPWPGFGALYHPPADLT
jgi:hypothetical protein